MILDEADEGMQNSIDSLERKFQKIRAGKASPQMLEGIKIDYYGAITPLDQAANINTPPDPKQIIIQPWDKTMLPVIEKSHHGCQPGF